MGLISNQGVRPLGDDHNEFITREAKTLALDKDFLNIAMLGDREIIGSTPKNPVNKRDG